MTTQYSFDSFYRMFKKKGFFFTCDFVKSNPKYKKMLTRAVAVARAQTTF